MRPRGAYILAPVCRGHGLRVAPSVAYDQGEVTLVARDPSGEEALRQGAGS
jgi:hypothetical protein